MQRARVSSAHKQHRYVGRLHHTADNKRLCARRFANNVRAPILGGAFYAAELCVSVCTIIASRDCAHTRLLRITRIVCH